MIHCYTRAISERFRDKELIIKRYVNSSVYLLITFYSWKDGQAELARVVTFGPSKCKCL